MPDLLDELEKRDVDSKRVVLNDKEETIFAVSFCLIPSFNQTLKELKKKIEYIGKSLVFMNASSLYLSCNGNIINEDDVKKEILHKNRATIVCIGWPQGIIDESPRNIHKLLYIVNFFSKTVDRYQRL